MEQRRINLSDLAIGQPLAWDVYDSSGKLLLNKGYVVQRSQQIDTLLERGMFVEAGALQ